VPTTSNTIGQNHEPNPVMAWMMSEGVFGIRKRSPIAAMAIPEKNETPSNECVFIVISFSSW